MILIAEDNPSEITAEPCSASCIRLTWRAPVKSNHSPTLYTILTNINYESTQQTTATAIDIDQLLPATAYTFHVYSTSIGGGWYTPGVKAMATTFPEDQVYTYELTAWNESATKVTLFWVGKPEAFTPGRKFLIITRPAGMPAITTRKQYVQLEGLDPHNFYRFSVYAFWANGTPSDTHMSVDYTSPREDDTLPTELTAKVLSSSSIRLNWKPATRSDLQRPLYTIECNSQRYTTDKTTYDMINLADGRLHSFKLWSTQSSGSFYLPPLQLTASTWDIVEKNPTDVVAEACSSTCIRLTWKAPKQSDWMDKFYTVVTNSDYNNAQQTEKNTIDIEYLSPGTNYVFTVHAKSAGDFLYEPGGHASARTLEGA